MDVSAMIAPYIGAIFVVNGLLAFIPAYIAGEKGRSSVAFWALSFFTTTFVGLIAVLALPPVEKEIRTLRTDEHGKLLADETEMPEAIKCPFCAEMVKSEASICRYCQKDISNHVQALKSQIEKNIETSDREAAARVQEFELQIEVRRQRRRSLFQSTWFRISVAGGILAVAATVILSPYILTAMKADAEQAAIAGLLDDVKGIKVAGDACGAGSAISYSAGQAKVSVFDSRDVADCVLKALSGQDVVWWDLHTGLGKIANGYEFIWRGEFLTIVPQK